MFLEHLKSKVFLFLGLLFLLSCALRIYSTRHGNFPFWFDLGRDAVVSRTIIETRHLKIQGPSASGTQDTVYHGVLFYYLIGPLYTFAHGNPQVVLIAIIIFSSLAIFPTQGAKRITDWCIRARVKSNPGNNFRFCSKKTK